MRYALLGLVLGSAVLLCACGSIERRTELATSSPLGQAITAGPGDTVMDFKATKSLPNAFGKADLFGRTTDAGRIVVRYVGTENGNAIFVRNDLIVESNKTTMTETPLVTADTSTTSISGYSGGRPVSATAATTSYGVVGPRPTQTFASSAVPVTIKVGPGETLTAEGHTLTVIDVTKSTVRYAIQ